MKSQTSSTKAGATMALLVMTLVLSTSRARSQSEPANLPPPPAVSGSDEAGWTKEPPKDEAESAKPADPKAENQAMKNELADLKARKKKVHKMGEEHIKSAEEEARSLESANAILRAQIAKYHLAEEELQTRVDRVDHRLAEIREDHDRLLDEKDAESGNLKELEDRLEHKKADLKNAKKPRGVASTLQPRSTGGPAPAAVAQVTTVQPAHSGLQIAGSNGGEVATKPNWVKLARKCNLLSGKSSDSSSLGVQAGGSSVSVQRHIGHWYEVQLGTGKKGFMSDTCFRLDE